MSRACFTGWARRQSPCMPLVVSPAAVRSPRLSIFALGVFSNRLVLAGILAEVAIALLIVYTGPGNGRACYASPLLHIDAGNVLPFSP